eukprot:CAMPEP_0180513848 /NCGR_PEP_ID=MMETSP1036_2-20121128/52403_1 /TAXON_ID=632150 /ORGANISM="Azadinium spinosum, Strain 3D9" /LENGTH=44 /DNA_ID= /DNA_START= /DNA_END= /DNA_ORIENTATION=
MANSGNNGTKGIERDSAVPEPHALGALAKLMKRNAVHSDAPSVD